MTSLFGDSTPIIKEGWLSKRSKYLKEWRRFLSLFLLLIKKRRWFVLTANKVYTFKEQNKYEDPTEIIPLNECFTVKSAEEEIRKANSIVSVPYC